jgi:hypothetical protein
MTIQLVLKAYGQAFSEGRGNITVPNLIRSESTSIESTRGSEPNESRDLRTVTGFTDSYVTYKGIYIARSPSTLLAP